MNTFSYSLLGALLLGLTASAFAQTTYFEPRTAPAPAILQQVEAPPAARPTEPAKAAVSNAKRDSLDRFKKMPDLSKQTH